VLVSPCGCEPAPPPSLPFVWMAWGRWIGPPAQLAAGRALQHQPLTRALPSAACSAMGRAVQLVYTSRDRLPGVPHHAKAGNINNALLKAGDCSADFALVLDCDMIVHPDFLQRTLGHFYEQRERGAWALKPKAAFLQTPQDFWNVAVTDPMGHAARFFYGPMLQVRGRGRECVLELAAQLLAACGRAAGLALTRADAPGSSPLQGRDGLGAAPCCGTGVVFRRDILVSIGGQAYGSVTEDYNTAMHLMSAGFSTMYLNERLVFGMVPDDVAGGRPDPLG
jgi:cellulose synthase (UDP-forming)